MTIGEIKSGLSALTKQFNPSSEESKFILGAVEALEQESCDDFARWVAREIFDENWEYNKDAFAELACRKLSKLGIVRAKGDEWVLDDPQAESGE